MPSALEGQQRVSEPEWGGVRGGEVTGPGGPKDSGSTLRKMGAMAGVSRGEMWLHRRF